MSFFNNKVKSIERIQSVNALDRNIRTESNKIAQGKGSEDKFLMYGERKELQLAKNSEASRKEFNAFVNRAIPSKPKGFKNSHSLGFNLTNK